MLFRNRRAAGRELATRLSELAAGEPIVLGLPRGGVVVADEIATALGAPLDVLLVRKIGMPGRRELAIGAIGEGEVVVHNDDVLRQMEIGPRQLGRATEREAARLARQVAAYRRGRHPLDVTGRTVLLTDDGIATGATVRAAIRILRARRAGAIVLAVPVAPKETLAGLSAAVDYTVCPTQPVWMRSVSNWYAEFDQVSQAEVLALLRENEVTRGTATVY
jgi:putative phosphoribosyl transferase